MLGFFTHVCVLFVGLLFTAANSDEPVYRAVGDEVVLTPGPVSDPITIITWRHGQNIAVEWFKGSVESFRQFKERGDINGTTGALTITGLTPGDSGNYTAEINHRETRTTQLLVISRVSKPTVSKRCDPVSCVFTCESDTTSAEPVTYSWISQEKSWDSTKELRIKNEELENQFYCELSNPVSTEDSEMVQNPFSAWKWYEILLIVCAVLTVAAVIGFYWKIKGGKWYQILLIVCAVLIVPAGFGFNFIYWEIKGGKWCEKLLIVLAALILPAGFGFYFIYWKKRGGIGCTMLLIFWAFLIVIAVVILSVIYWEIGQGRRPPSEIFEYEGKWYLLVLIVLAALILPAGFGFYFICLEIKGGWRPTSESTSGRSIPVFSCRYNIRDRGPGSDGPGGAEPRPENVSAPTSTVPLENSEEKEALVGSSQDQDPESRIQQSNRHPSITRPGPDRRYK